MKKRFTLKASLVLITFLCLIQLVNAQDTIVKMNNSRIVAKIIEINPKMVKYKKFDYPDGPIIIIDKRHVSRIIYANGAVDTLSMKPIKLTNGVPKTDPRIKDFGKNYLSLVVSDMFFGMASVGYERISNNGKFSFKVPVSFNFRSLQLDDSIGYHDHDQYYSNNWSGLGYYSKYKTFSTGLEFYYYTGGQGTLRYFIGPCIEYAQINYYKFHQTSGAQQYPYNGYFTKDNGYYFAFLVKNGLIFQPTKNLNVSFNAGAGFFSPETDHDDYDGYNPFYTIDEAFSIEVGLNIGYRF